MASWIAKDEHHSRNGITPDFFLHKFSLCFAIEDQKGVILFVRVDRIGPMAFLYIQFDGDERRRTAIALAYSYPRVREMLKTIGISVITFDSASPTLVAFCLKHLGFSPVPDFPDRYIASI